MSSNKTKINENINNNNKILHFTAERNYNQIFPNENNYSNNINHIIKRHESINNTIIYSILLYFFIYML